MTTTLALPTEKTSPTLKFETAKTLLYGHGGIGKTTTAVALNPDHALLLATEPGYGGLEAFVQPVTNWREFREAGTELAKGQHPFELLIVDTVDELFRMCQDHVVSENRIKHPSDLEWGKGWQLLGDEFRLRVAKLCALGYGVVFISHAKDEEIKQRVGTITKTVPSLSGSAAKWLLGFVDYVLFATSEVTETGEQRILHTAPSENWMGKARIALPDPLPLDASALTDAMAKTCTPPAEPAAEPEPEEKAA